jgi:hypothetical protein
MKPITVIICCIFCLMAYLSFIFPVSIFAENEEGLSCEESRIKGEITGKEEHKSGQFLARGTISGIFFPVSKPGITVATAACTKPQPSYVLNKETINVICSREGYSKVAKKKNINGALVVGLIGTAIIITTLSIIVVANRGFAPDLDLGPIPISINY